jgi:hypothetical protein
MQPAVGEPAIRQAAVLTAHWTARDIEAVIMLMADTMDADELKDLIIALLLVREMTPDEIRKIILTTMELA